MDKIKIKRSVLFVDDEPKVIQGLQRMLRCMRNEWDMNFAQSGSEALEILENVTVDVIVTDMRMPGMDGPQLLKQVQQHYPMIVRIVLSGHSEQEMVLKSVLYAHQYLSKPCDSDLLISTVRRSCALRDLLDQESLMRIMSQIESFPSLPSLYNKIMEELQSPGGSIQVVGKIIEKDPCMSAKILQLVNSSFFGLPRHVSNPSEAVLLLGIDTVRSLVLTIGLFSKFDQATLSTMHIQNIYKHSIKTGTIAREIAKMEDMAEEEIDNAFMAGLLHDLGKLVLAAYFPDAFREVCKLSGDGEEPFHEAEIKKLGASHAEVGAYLLSLWGLPDSIVEGVAFHHNPGLCSAMKFCPQTAVYAANILEKHPTVSGDAEKSDTEFDAEYMMRLSIDEKIPVWMNIAEQIKRMEGQDEQ